MKGNWWAWRVTSECKLLQFWDCKTRVIFHTDASVLLKQRPWGALSLVISILVFCSADLEDVQLLLFLSCSQWRAITEAMERNFYCDWGLFQHSTRAFPVFCTSASFSVFLTQCDTLEGWRGGRERIGYGISWDHWAMTSSWGAAVTSLCEASMTSLENRSHWQLKDEYHLGLQQQMVFFWCCYWVKQLLSSKEIHWEKNDIF